MTPRKAFRAVRRDARCIPRWAELEFRFGSLARQAHGGLRDDFPERAPQDVLDVLFSGSCRDDEALLGVEPVQYETRHDERLADSMPRSHHHAPVITRGSQDIYLLAPEIDA